MRRYEIERAVLDADLPGPSVAIMLSLCTRIYADEGVIPAHAQPSLNQLAADTGFDRSTVIRHLADPLEAQGWLVRVRPPRWLARQLHVTTSYAMRVPADYPQARGGVRQALGALRGEARSTALQALAAHEAEARRAMTTDLGASGDEARGARPHNTDQSESRDTDPAAECPHGKPGGQQLGKTRKPKCPLCRQEQEL